MTNEEWRNHRYYKFDPFAGRFDPFAGETASKIQPALLNSADIKKYVDKGCLIEQDDFDMERLKTASYEMRFLGELHYWTTKDGALELEPRCRKICCGSPVELPGNSITYLWMKEKLLLPEYIAARFNLHIRHVHKGILLGTGPLVDPGFFGNLLIPLHNLTNNDYELDGGDGIIWVEFTKMNEHEFWKSQGNKNPPDLKSFPHGKYIKDARGYLRKSGIIDKKGVQSALKVSLNEAETNAEAAKKNAEDARTMIDDSRKEVERSNKKFQKIGFIALVIGGVTIALTIIGATWTGYSMISDAVSRVQDSRNQALSLKLQKQDDKLKKFEADLDEIKTNLSRISNSSNEPKQHHDESDGIENPQLDSVQDQQINE